jgi:hypothetical protein
MGNHDNWPTVRSSNYTIFWVCFLLYRSIFCELDKVWKQSLHFLEKLLTVFHDIIPLMTIEENALLNILPIVPKPIEPSPCCSRANSGYFGLPVWYTARQDHTLNTINGAEILLEVWSVLSILCNVIIYKLSELVRIYAYHL